MELRQLRYFITLASTLNFRKAAEQLHITQPTLSQQISSIEEELGDRLFSRSTRSVALTATGHELLVGVRDEVTHIDRCIASIQSRNHDANRKTLRLGLDSFANGLEYFGLLEVLPAFKRAHEDVDVEVNIIDNQESWVDGQRNSFDLSFMIVPDDVWPTLSGASVLIRRDRFVLSVSADYVKRNPEDTIADVLQKLPLYLLEGDIGLNRYIQSYLHDRNIEFTCKYLKRIPSALEDLVSSGIGVMFDLQGLLKQYMNPQNAILDFPDTPWSVSARAFVHGEQMRAEANDLLQMLLDKQEHTAACTDVAR